MSAASYSDMGEGETKNNLVFLPMRVLTQQEHETQVAGKTTAPFPASWSSACVRVEKCLNFSKYFQRTSNNTGCAVPWTWVWGLRLERWVNGWGKTKASCSFFFNSWLKWLRACTIIFWWLCKVQCKKLIPQNWGLTSWLCMDTLTLSTGLSVSVKISA